MAINTYPGLVAAVQEFTGRSDITTAKVDHFIDLAENYFNNNLRTHEMETTNGALTVSSGLVTHPSDWLGWKNLSLTSNGTRYSLRPTSLEAREFFDPAGTTGTPTRYTVRGTSTLLIPTPDSTGYTYSGTYYQKIPALSDTQSANWILTNYSDAYLYGTLAMTEVYIQNDPRVSLWKSLFQESVSGLKQNDLSKGFGQVGVMTTEYPVY